VSVVFCQVEFPVSGWSPFQRSLTESGVAGRNLEAWTMRRSWLTGGLLGNGEEVSKTVMSVLKINVEVRKIFLVVLR